MPENGGAGARKRKSKPRRHSAYTSTEIELAAQAPGVGPPPKRQRRHQHRSTGAGRGPSHPPALLPRSPLGQWLEGSVRLGYLDVTHDMEVQRALSRAMHAGFVDVRWVRSDSLSPAAPGNGYTEQNHSGRKSEGEAEEMGATDGAHRDFNGLVDVRLIVHAVGTPEDADAESASTVDAAIRTVLDRLGLLFAYDSADDSVEESPAARLYDCVSGEKPEQNLLMQSVSTTHIATPLKNYQKRATAWMLWREQCSSAENVDHPLCKQIVSDPPIFVNVATGKLSSKAFDAPPCISGGILADEMGIGKSLVCLCLICSTLQRRQEPEESPSLHQPDYAGERCDCMCGARNSLQFQSVHGGGETIQCSVCMAWQHENCIRWRHTKERKDVVEKGCEYVCGRCNAFVASQEDDRANATLIICPSQILQQWLREIESHVLGRLSVYVYRGQDQSVGGGSTSGCVVTPAFLASHDVVITTYAVISQELAYNPGTRDDDTKGIAERKRSRSGAPLYCKIPTPLTRVKPWRRCVLDEAQMIESTAAKPAEMARKIEAINKWCVTGTPMSSGLSDLYGLCLFLRSAPFDRPKLWRNGCESAARRSVTEITRLAKFFEPMTLRRARDDVAAELDIPVQHDITTNLRFSAIEAHHYQTEEQRAAREALTALSHEELSANRVPVVLRPLGRLRQACDHPQVGSHGLNTKHGEVLSLEQVHERLIDRARVQAEEAMRKLCMSLNGCAGLYALQSRDADAVHCYREVLTCERDGKDLNMRLDKLQKLHTLENLHSFLHPEPPSGVTRTLRDDSLKEEASQIADDYVREWRSKRAAAEEQVKRDKQTASEMASEVEEPWYAGVLQKVHRGKDEDKLLHKISYELDDEWQGGQIPFNSANGLAYKVSEDLKRMREARDSLFEKLKELDKIVDQPSDDDIKRAGRCYKCSQDMGVEGTICRHCEAEPYFDAAESVIFGRQLARNVDVGTGRSNPSSAEMALRTLSTMRITAQECSQRAKSHLQRLELLRKEFSHARTLWSAQRNVLTALDELQMATTRDRLREPAECPSLGEHDPVPEAWRSVILYPNEIQGLLEQRESDVKAHREELRNAQSKMRFLSRLQSSKNEDETDEACPICHIPIEMKEKGQEAAILQCGHQLHVKCALDLVKKTASSPMKSRNSSVSCPNCRSRTALYDVNYITAAESGKTTSQTPQASQVTHASDGSTAPEYLNTLLSLEEEQKLSGVSYGTKVEAVVKRILAILNLDMDAKVLVFSEWNDVLGILAHSLRENNVKHERAQGARASAQKALSRFTNSAAKRVLLLPFARGASGLTLVNASHVLLIEPQLDPGIESQAVKRVDRIGQQSESTCVHRFIVNRTVEERVQHIARQRAGAKGRLPDVAGSEKHSLTAADVSYLVTEGISEPQK